MGESSLEEKKGLKGRWAMEVKGLGSASKERMRRSTSPEDGLASSYVGKYTLYSTIGEGAFGK